MTSDEDHVCVAGPNVIAGQLLPFVREQHVIGLMNSKLDVQLGLTANPGCLISDRLKYEMYVCIATTYLG